MFELLLSAYSTISTQDTAQFLGMNENDATNCKILSYSVLVVSKSLFLVHKRTLNELKFIELLNHLRRFHRLWYSKIKYLGEVFNKYKWALNVKEAHTMKSLEHLSIYSTSRVFISSHLFGVCCCCDLYASLSYTWQKKNLNHNVFMRFH